MLPWNTCRFDNAAAQVVQVAITTWNPSDHSTDCHLSVNNTVYSGFGTGTYNNVRSVASHSSGKYYWKTVVTTEALPTAVAQGFGNASASLTALVGTDSGGLSWGGDGNIRCNGALITTIQTWIQGDTLAFALDLDHSKIWFQANGGNWNNDILANQNPATNTGGSPFTGLGAGPYFAIGGTIVSGDVYTTDFSGSGAPSGFGPL